MEPIWSRDPEAVRQELLLGARQRLPVALLAGGRPLFTGRLLRLLEHNDEELLVIRRPVRYRHLDPQLVEQAVYRFANRPPVTFASPICRVHGDLLACPLPDRLHFYQRRRHARFFVREQGVAAFFVDRRARVCRMRLEDISLGGARLVGEPRYDLAPAMGLGPATFSLLADAGRIVRELTLSRALVVRYRARRGFDVEIGLEFRLDRAERLALARLLTDPYGPRLFATHPGAAPGR